MKDSNPLLTYIHDYSWGLLLHFVSLPTVIPNFFNHECKYLSWGSQWYYQDIPNQLLMPVVK